MLLFVSFYIMCILKQLIDVTFNLIRYSPNGAPVANVCCSRRTRMHLEYTELLYLDEGFLAGRRFFPQTGLQSFVNSRNMLRRVKLTNSHGLPQSESVCVCVCELGWGALSWKI